MGLFRKKKKEITLEPVYSFDVVGMKYYEFAINSIGTPIKSYNYAHQSLVKMDKHLVYKYYFNVDTVDLIPEPTNPTDPNAIMVIVNDAHIGYVPSFFTGIVKEYLKRPCDITCEIHGGAHKKVFMYELEDGFTPYNAMVTIRLK